MENRIVSVNQESGFDEKTKTLFVAAGTPLMYNDDWDDMEDEELPVWYRYGYKAETIILAEGISEIGECAFCQSAVQEVVLPCSLQKIGECAFENCKALHRIVLPEGLTSIGSHAFAGCESLEEIVFPASLKELGEEAFADCRSLKSAVFMGALRDIPDFAFADCFELLKVKLPDKLETIGDGAFEGTGLKQICFPETLKRIGLCAFERCEQFQQGGAYAFADGSGLRAF